MDFAHTLDYELLSNYDPNKDNKVNRVEQMEKVQHEGLELFKKKNQDYGDAFATYGAIGVLVRMGDKISRLKSITSTNISLVNTESVRDTLIDLHNYSAMAIMLLDENEKKVSKSKDTTNYNSNNLECSEMAWQFMNPNNNNNKNNNNNNNNNNNKHANNEK
jgi:hypothetical protein